LRRASVFLVGSPLGFLAGPLTPDIRAQNDALRFAALLPGFNLEGFVVTAFLSLLPGLAALYDAIPLAFNPPVLLLPSDLVHAGVFAMLLFFNIIIK